MNEEQKSHSHPAQSATIIGPTWFIGWLFTIGFSTLGFWQGVLALIIWPYYLGTSIGG